MLLAWALAVDGVAVVAGAGWGWGLFLAPSSMVSDKKLVEAPCHPKRAIYGSEIHFGPLSA